MTMGGNGARGGGVAVLVVVCVLVPWLAGTGDGGFFTGVVPLDEDPPI